MKKNVNTLDRSVRLVVGLICAYIALFTSLSETSMLLFVVVSLFSIINLVSAAFSYCPVYHLAGISTIKE